MIVLGIDPGLDGALATYRPGLDHLDVTPMPTLKVKAGSERRILNDDALAQIFDVLCKEGMPMTAIVEAVGPGQSKGTVPSFQLGANWGVVRGCLAANFISREFVSPVTWKRAMRIPAGADKAMSIAMASRAFPRFVSLWTGGRKAQREGAAEAALLALYGWRFVLNQAEAA